MQRSLLIIISFCLLVAPCQAGLKVVGKGDSPVILITKGKPSAKVQKLIDYYLSDYRYVNRH